MKRLFILLFVCSVSCGLTQSFQWDANTEPDIAGYRIFSRWEWSTYDYENPNWEGTDTHAVISGLPDGIDLHFVARAYDIYGNESEDSNEITYYAQADILYPATGGYVIYNEIQQPENRNFQMVFLPDGSVLITGNDVTAGESWEW